jgi:hypothetical protein
MTHPGGVVSGVLWIVVVEWEGCRARWRGAPGRVGSGWFAWCGLEEASALGWAGGVDVIAVAVHHDVVVEPT